MPAEFADGAAAAAGEIWEGWPEGCCHFPLSPDTYLSVEVASLGAMPHFGASLCSQGSLGDFSNFVPGDCYH